MACNKTAYMRRNETHGPFGLHLPHTDRAANTVTAVTSATRLPACLRSTISCLLEQALLAAVLATSQRLC
jgi:hypothetical protein